MSDAPAAAPTVRTVLVVDDNDANRYAVTFWLRDAGLRTIEATSGAEAIDLARQQLPDLIVLDIRLPDTTGFEVVRVLRAEPETGAIPILHLSASYTTAEWRTHGLELGADAYLTHPVEPRELVATVRTLLRVKEVEEQLRASAHEAQSARRDAEQAAARATALQAITAELAGTMTAAEVATVAMAQAMRLTGAAVVALGVVGEGGTLELVASRQVPDDVLARWRDPAAATPLATVALSDTRAGATIALGTLARIAEQDAAWAQDAGRLGVASLHGVPLVVGPVGERRTLGALLFGWRAEQPADWRGDPLAAGLADQCAQALERARLYQAAQHARGTAEDAQRRAEAANRSKAEFLANMSHELRTPLNAIGGYAQLLEMEIRGPITEAQQEDLRRLQKAQRHLLGLINDLLNFAKLDAGRVQFEIAELDVDEAIDGVEPLVRPQLNARGIEYEVTHSGGQRVWADAEKLRQVLVNLLGNAVKYTAPGGVVRIATSHDADHVTIRVADTGSGIPADKLRDIFDPFVQVGRSLSAVGDGGVGLGLAISRGIVHAMGGDIWAESEVGRGSTFFVRLGRRKPETSW